MPVKLIVCGVQLRVRSTAAGYNGIHSTHILGTYDILLLWVLHLGASLALNHPGHMYPHLYCVFTNELQLALGSVCYTLDHFPFFALVCRVLAPSMLPASVAFEVKQRGVASHSTCTHLQMISCPVAVGTLLDPCITGLGKVICPTCQWH